MPLQISTSLICMQSWELDGIVASLGHCPPRMRLTGQLVATGRLSPARHAVGKAERGGAPPVLCPAEGAERAGPGGGGPHGTLPLLVYF